MRKNISIVLVIVMVLSMTTTAFAGFSGTLRDENGNTVEQTTISDSTSGESKKGYSGTASNSSGVITNENVTPATPQQSTTTNTKIKSFSDVSSKHWAYSAVMNMVKKGMLEGTTEPVNGVGTFSPDKTMNRAEFVTVVVRYLYADEVSQQPKGDYWYSPYYNVAVDNGLIKTGEFNEASMKHPMNRQEMALVIVRAMNEAGEDVSSMVNEEVIPDFTSVGTYYKISVRQAYQAGMIAGVDNVGTFSPLGTLTRAQAATVLNRLVDASTRAKISGSDSEEMINPNGGQIWVEGEHHTSPKVGDIVIKKDGTRVVIEETIVNGYCPILGYKTGVDIWDGIWGMEINDYDSAPDHSFFFRAEAINEMHSETEWNAIMAATNPYNDPYNRIVGDYDGERYEFYWEWDSDKVDHITGEIGMWVWLGGHT